MEAFSIGFPPTLAGILRTETGWRVRVLPGFARRDEEREEGDDGSVYKFTMGRRAKAGETEYRIGLIPFGGFVKVLGQEDTKAAEKSDDPRAYMNRPVSARMLFAAGGVVCNVVSAVLVFMVVFLAGINLPPPIVGDVLGGSPAAETGLQAGDEILEIGGKSYNLDFVNIREAGAFNKKGQKVTMKVRKRDGSVEEVQVEARKMGTPLKIFGFDEPLSLTIAKLAEKDAGKLYERTGLRPGDTIVAVNGKDTEHYWQLIEAIKEEYAPSAAVLVKRGGDAGANELAKVEIGLDMGVGVGDANSEASLAHVYSMVPRLKIAWVSKELEERGDGPKVGDVIVNVGGAENPTYVEMRQVTEEHEGKELAVEVLRNEGEVERTVTVNVRPRKVEGRVVIGIGIALDGEHAVVAKTIEAGEDVARLDIPRGARIEAVDGREVSSFYDVINEIRAKAGERISVEWRLSDLEAGSEGIPAREDGEYIAVRVHPAGVLPFKAMTRLYKARGPLEAIGMGFDKGVTFIRQAYMTLKGFLVGRISAKNFMGPVGILTLSYKIAAEETATYYLYWLGLLSAFIAVFNSLPLLPFDGGHIVFLAIEKVKGSPVSERVQGAAVYAGVALVLAFVLYVTWNDIWRLVRLVRGGWF